jgi:hypothetical protein
LENCFSPSIASQKVTLIKAQGFALKTRLSLLEIEIRRPKILKFSGGIPYNYLTGERPLSELILMNAFGASHLRAPSEFNRKVEFTFMYAIPTEKTSKLTVLSHSLYIKNF